MFGYRQIIFSSKTIIAEAKINNFFPYLQIFLKKCGNMGISSH
jgi:hypothetical protein